jgi:hypothetical protein
MQEPQPYQLDGVASKLEREAESIKQSHAAGVRPSERAMVLAQADTYLTVARWLRRRAEAGRS